MSEAEGVGAIPTTDELGARLALIRWQQGWNQKEAALACGLPQNSWREWEVSGRAPRNLVEVADKIAATTGVDAYWIITGRPPPHGGGDAPRVEPGLRPTQGYLESIRRFYPNLVVAA